MTKTVITLVFPHQLFEKSSALSLTWPIYLFEAPRFFTDFSFHKQKLHFHRATMQAYRDELLKKGYSVYYGTYDQAEQVWQELAGYKEIHYTDPVDTKLEKELITYAHKNSIKLVWHETPAFLSCKEWVTKELGNKKRYNHATFYISQRKRLQILLESDGSPVGGKWSFDTENRKRLPKDVTVPSLSELKKSSLRDEAQEYVKKHFPHNPGELETNCYPTTRVEAKKWLDLFLTERLALFGAYEDAIDKDETLLFHSLLSPLLNCGLLTPDYIIEKTLKYAQETVVPLESLEGFIRQIIGWREFIRGIYILSGEEQRTAHFFKHTRKLPFSFWKGTTGIEPVDTTIKKVLKSAYCHHIERLMILSNFMLLTETDPDEVYRWFMELFIDAYDWVMVPNIYGMGQYADGGRMVTKPYISGSNYILTMSNYKKDAWSDVWDALYWNFIAKNILLLEKNPRFSLITASLKRMPEEKLSSKRAQAEAYVKSLGQKNPKT